MTSPEERLTSHLGGVPLIVERAREIDRPAVVRALLDDYVGNELPADAVDGVFLTLSVLTRSPYTAYFHAARLVGRSADPGVLGTWLELTGWEDVSPLVSQLAAGEGRTLDMAVDADRMLLARCAVASLVTPTLAGPLHAALQRTLPDPLVSGLRRMRRFWAGLFPVVSGAALDPFEDDPVIAPHAAVLGSVLSDVWGDAPSFASPAPGRLRRSEGRAITEDVAVTLVESFPVGVIRLDAEGRIVYENPELRRIIGADARRASPAMGSLLSELPNVRSQPVASRVRHLVATGEPIERTRFEFTSLFGRESWLSAEARPLGQPPDPANGSVVVLTDITREVALERQLIQAQKAEIFGTLAGGIAHDLNNFLVGITGWTELVLRRLGPEDPAREPAEKLRRATERLGGVVDGLLALARPQDASTGQETDCANVLRDASTLLSGLMPASVAVITHGTETPVWASISRVHLEQVVVNVCVNARDAIRSHRDRGQIDVTLRQDGDDVTIEIADDGGGMPPRVVERIFQPFFTTKPAGEGTGLGLAVSRAIVRAQGGDLTCESTPGVGTRFLVRLRAAANAAPPPTVAAPARAHGHLLVVDDSEVVRTLCQDVLQAAGYTVVVAEGVAQAKEQVASRRPFAGALVDMGLPDGSGAILAEELGCPVLLMSGGHPAAAEERPFLKKPFGIRDLLDAVRALVGSAR